MVIPMELRAAAPAPDLYRLLVEEFEYIAAEYREGGQAPGRLIYAETIAVDAALRASSEQIRATSDARTREITVSRVRASSGGGYVLLDGGVRVAADALGGDAGVGE